MNGITYYRLKSDYPGDYTKNCALHGTEVDNNFYVLEGRDVKSIAVNGRDIVLTLLNGDNVTGKGVLNFVTPEDMSTTVVNVEFNKTTGVLKLTNADGSVQNIEGFATSETHLGVASDNTLKGSGLKDKPLGVAPSARTGQYKPVKAIINLADGGSLPSCGNLPGDRYITCEDISDYGYLYDYRAVHKIACELKKTGWRIPTKADWDDLLNAVEPCDCDKNHDKGDKNRFLGRWAGKLLKSKTMWMDCGCDCDCDDCDCDDCHHHHHHHHDCDCHSGCKSGEDVCFDYSEDPCAKTNESEEMHKHHYHHDCHHEHQGLDAYGFRVTPAGYADDGCNYGYFKERAAFWTATTDPHNTKAYIKRFHYNKDGVYQDIIASNCHLSLRLIKDYDGANYNDVETIMEMEYPTLLLPSATKGSAIWTACNFASGNAALCPMLPNNGSGLTFTRHHFINEWDGFKWVRNEIKQSESVVVENAPKGRKAIEYRLIGNRMCAVNEMIYHDVMHDVKDTMNNLETKLTDRIVLVEKSVEVERELRAEEDKRLWGGLSQESDRAKQVEAELWEGLSKEASARQETDNEQWAAIENEGTIREQEDKKLYEAIESEAQARQEVDDQQWHAIEDESRLREMEDGKLYEAIAAETAAREEVERQLWEGIAAEAAAREEVDNQQWAAIENEGTIREQEDKKLYEAIESEAQARQEVDDQQWHAIEDESRLREMEDGKLYAALAEESKIREEIDNQQWDAINTEREERKAKDEEIEGKLLTQEGTEFDTKEGVLTLKSAAGTNDVTVQFSFNFGEF